MINFVVTFFLNLVEEGMIALDVSHGLDQIIQNARPTIYRKLKADLMYGQ